MRKITLQVGSTILWEDGGEFSVTFTGTDGKEHGEPILHWSEYGPVILSRDFVKSLCGGVVTDSEGEVVGVVSPKKQFHPVFPEKLNYMEEYPLLAYLGETLAPELEEAYEESRDFWKKTEAALLKEKFLDFFHEEQWWLSKNEAINVFMSGRQYVYLTPSEALDALV